VLHKEVFQFEMKAASLGSPLYLFTEELDKAFEDYFLTA
jgi:hypothetical protein